MKTIANLATVEEAQHLKLILEREGLASFIPDEFSASVAPHFFMAQTGIRLQVSEADEQAAIKILSEVFAVSD